jgi:hypothetical protein
MLRSMRYTRRLVNPQEVTVETAPAYKTKSCSSEVYMQETIT